MMKKLLLGSTAIVGATVMTTSASAGTAQSGDNYSVSLGGVYEHSFQWYDQDVSAGKGRGYTVAGDEAEVYIRARATADNGITYGVNIELNANTDDGTAADEIIGYFDSDTWGRVELGDNDSAADRMLVQADDILAGRAGWDASEWESTLNAGNALITSDNSQVSDDSKVIYFTPRFAGFQLGASLTPDSGHAGLSATERDDDGDFENVWSLGANWEGEFGDVGVIVSATYELGDSEPNTAGGVSGVTEEDLEELGLGANVTFGGFAIGAGYVDLNDSGLTQAQVAAGEDSGFYYNVGVAYGTGPWNVSLGWYHSEVGNTAPASDTETDFDVLGATYNLAPGWQIASDFNVVNIDNQNGGVGAAAVDNDYMALVISNIFTF